MAGISITGSTQPVQDALGRIASIGRDPSRVLLALGRGVVRNTRSRMKDGVDPRGVKWDSYAPLNPLYASGKEGPGILRGKDFSSSGLYASLTARVRGNVLEWGSGKVYARIHQMGGWIFPKNKPYLSFEMGGIPFSVKSVFIPERPYLGFTADDRAMMMTELEEFLERAMKS
ncbi:phage virion morphogenesis protein [Acetobacter fallax]|uniref:Virion morphogenesis protein n=1 Tax=Acetobacter fallax TaxID=1737473 RepID=A0ABX0KDV1_9PROT|nr:phage virion morphogenesis protein [Acetobacter fallax]NHO33321.1 virion morphogenesis protein [Acetobacter fallax]NHO36942.1 virion morphogenesis protein [Acetobacter fallax]